MGKIKCVKMECSVCHKEGLAQIFLNRKGEINYARVRHYSHTDKVSHKPQFTYCKIEDLVALKTLLSNANWSIGQVENRSNNLLNSSLNQEFVEPRAGFGPATITLPR